jgi:hypothetical protein
MVNIDAAREGKTFAIEKGDMVFGHARFGLSARLPEFPRIDEGVVKLQVDGPDIERFRDVFNLPGAATGPFSVGFTRQARRRTRILQLQPEFRGTER